MTTSNTSQAPSGAAHQPDRFVRWPDWMDRVGELRPLIWLVFAAAAALLPQSSWLLAGFMLLAGGFMFVGSRAPDLRVRVALLGAGGAVGVVASFATPQNGLAVIPLFVAPALVARVVASRRVVMVFGACGSICCAVGLFWVGRTSWASLGALSVPFIVMSTWDREAVRREHTRVLELLGELESRRDADVRAAAATERARIARDLHDVLAHTLSGLSLHMQAIRAVLAGRTDIPEAVTASVDKAADLARTGLDEARHAVAALREDTDRAPGGRELAALVGGHDGAELAVDGDFDALAPTERETAFATVRESLTNAERHAPGARVQVAVRTGETLHVRVSDDGAARPVTAGDHGGGNGLSGLVERAAAVGGTLTARPDPPGWTVELRIPTARAASLGVDDHPARDERARDELTHDELTHDEGAR